MILVAVGANLPSQFGSPYQACREALRRLTWVGIDILAISQWWQTAPVPMSDQPWYVNGVASIETTLSPESLLEYLHRIEADMGRVRTVRNAPRIIDLDLLAYHDEVSTTRPPLLPHPRMGERAFVLYPLADIAPDWRHPVTGIGVATLIAALPPGQIIRKIPVEEME